MKVGHTYNYGVNSIIASKQGAGAAKAQAAGAAGIIARKDSVEISAQARKAAMAANAGQNNPPIPTKDEYISKYLAGFDKIDADKDGVLTDKEAVNFINNLLNVKGEDKANDAASILAQAFNDIAVDKKITKDSAESYLNTLYDDQYGAPAPTGGSAGIPSLKDYLAEWKAVFKAADTNKDNIVGDKEMVNYINQTISGLAPDEANQKAAGLSTGFMMAQGGDMKVSASEAKAFLVQNYKDLYGPETNSGNTGASGSVATITSNVQAPAPQQAAKDPLFTALNKSEDDYITLDEVNAWVKNIALKNGTPVDQAVQLRQRALEAFRDAVQLARQNGLAEGQPANSINYQQYQLFLNSKA